MIWSTITQKDLELSTDKTDLPYQYSDGITLKFMKDTKYNGYAVVPYVGVCDTELISCVDKFERLQALTMNVDGTFKVSNKVMFNSGYLYVAFDLVSSNEIIHVGNVIYKINASIGNATVLPEDDLTWQEVVKSFMEEYERINFTEKINALISTAEEQQKNVTSLQTSVNSAIKTLNALLNSMQDKLSNGDFVPNITLGNVSIGVPNVSFRGTGKDVIVDFTMPEFAGIEEYDKVIRDYIFEVGTDYYAKVESDEYSGHTYNSGVDLLKIDGAYSQETTNGKNLLNITSTGGTNNGITYTINDDKSVTLKGATTDTVSQLILNIMTIPNGTYCLNGTNTANVYMRIWSETQQKEIYKSVNSGSFEITNNDVCQIQIYIHKGVTCNNVIIYPQLELGSTATSYEPYTGGIASPNPEYPQEPKFVGDIGQNLFDASKLPTKSQGGATVTNNGDGSFTISGSGTLSENFGITYSATNMVNCLKQGNITLDCVNISYPYIEVQLKKEDDSNLIVLTNNSNSRNSTNITQEILSQISKIWVYIYGRKDDVIVENVIKPTLYQDGNGEYRPFSETPKYYLDFVTSGKNLFNINGNVNVDGYSKEQKTTNTVENGVLTCNVNSARNHGVGQRLYGLKGKTISVSAKLKSLGEATIGNIYIYESRGAYKAVSNATALDTVFAINNYTCQTDDIVVAFAGTGGTGVQFYDIMVNYGAKFVDYEPFTGFETTTVQLNQPLRELPNGVKDTVENGVVTRRVGEITFDGSEAWVRNNPTIANNWNYYIAMSHNIGDGLCDSLMHRGINIVNNNGSKIEQVGFNLNFIKTVMYLNVGYYMEQAGLTNTVANLKTWLQSNPITVWYELATPTTEQITLPTLPSWYPYANIWQAQEVKANVIYGIRSNSNIGMDIVDKAINDAINKAMQDIITNAELIEVLKSYLPLTGGNITGSLTINNNVAINSRDTSNVIRSLAKITAENITALGSIYLPLQLYGNTAPAWNNGSVKKTLATLDDIPPIKKVTTTVNVHNEMDPQLLELSLPTGYTTANTTIVAFNEYSNNIKSVPTYSTANLTANNKIQISYIYTGSDTKTVTLEVTVMKSA